MLLIFSTQRSNIQSDSEEWSREYRAQLKKTVKNFGLIIRSWFSRFEKKSYAFFHWSKLLFNRICMIRLHSIYTVYNFQFTTLFHFHFLVHVGERNHCKRKKIRPRNFEESPRFRLPWIRKKQMLKLCVCACVRKRYNPKNATSWKDVFW